MGFLVYACDMFCLRSHRWIMLLALCAILVRAAIPLGYMPDQKNGKSFQMVVCSLDGPKTVTVDAGFDPEQKSGKTDHATKLCDFALIQHSPASAPVTDLLADILHIQKETGLLPVIVAAGLLNHAYTPSQPRGPPSVSA